MRLLEKHFCDKLEKSIKEVRMQLALSERDILTHAGTISQQQALEKVRAEYEKYREQHLNDESPVEKHFIEAVKDVQRVEVRK